MPGFSSVLDPTVERLTSHGFGLLTHLTIDCVTALPFCLLTHLLASRFQRVEVDAKLIYALWFKVRLNFQQINRMLPCQEGRITGIEDRLEGGRYWISPTQSSLKKSCKLGGEVDARAKNSSRRSRYLW